MKFLDLPASHIHTFVNMAHIRRDERGVSALEYALIASLIGLAIVTAVTNYGLSLAGFFTKLKTKVASL